MVQRMRDSHFYKLGHFHFHHNQTTMSSSAPSSFCRVAGLTSEAGKKRNGSAARANLQQQTGSGADSRHPVCLDGFPGPMLMKRINIDVFPDNSRVFSVGVGRETILDEDYNAVLIDNNMPSSRSCITGGAARSRGSVEAMKKFVQIHGQQSGFTIIKLTDLNIARAFNRVACGEDNVCVAEPLNKAFQKVVKRFPKENDNRKVMVKFESHRISEDQFETKKSDKCGPQRYESVMRGTYQIYPCALKQYLDAHEVRYADTSGNQQATIFHHEIYLDYGVEEATMYAKHAAALGESDRLHPSVLAAVDPQAFWSAVLWYESFIQTLQELDLSVDLIDAWKDLAKGRTKSKQHFSTASMIFDFGPALTKGPEQHWGVTKSKDLHVRIATDFAICAFEAIHTAVIESGVAMSGVVLRHLDYYKGHEIESYFEGKSKFHELAKEEKEKYGEDIDPERILKLYNRAMRSSGFGRDSNVCLPEAERTCDNCGKRSKTKLQTCARCEGVSYCNAKCQKEHWKEHRNTCSRVFVQVQKQFANMSMNSGVEFKAAMYPTGSTKLPTTPGIYVEVSGSGSVRIMWCPGSINTIFVNNATDSTMTIAEREYLAQYDKSFQRQIRFRDFSELPPPLRFLVCCGPLPKLDLVQQCVDDAIASSNGALDQLRFPVAGFTALEWAAKKGNRDIVTWLCTDTRTKDLINVGCPVGWAGYTGQVDIMRQLVSYGADPSKTDDVLWSKTIPLFVAAQNGKLDAVKFYVEECNQDIGIIDDEGNNILKHIEKSHNWREIDNHVETHKWAKSMLKKQQKRKNKSK